jgi:hypothetical protein
MKTLSTLVLAAITSFTLACGYTSKPTTPSTPGTVPAIAQLAPNSMAHGGPAFVLTVNGSDFASKATINFAGTAQTTTFVSGNQVMATIPASAIATAGTVTVTVTNPGTAGTGAYGSGGTLAETSSAVNFIIL